MATATLPSVSTNIQSTAGGGCNSTSNLPGAPVVADEDLPKKDKKDKKSKKDKKAKDKKTKDKKAKEKKNVTAEKDVKSIRQVKKKKRKKKYLYLSVKI